MGIQSPSSDPVKPSLTVTHLIQKLDSIAEFYQQQLDWVDETTRMVETETESENEHLSETDAKDGPFTSAALRRMRWRRQMRSLESKLNGKVRRSRRKSRGGPERDKFPSLRLDGQGPDYILHGFGRIMGARMESCRRVQKLLKLSKRSSGVLDAVRDLETAAA